MATDKQADDFHIGAAPHTGRNLGILAGVLALGGLAAGVMLMGQRSDTAALEKLTAFTTVYSSKCDDRVAGAPTPMLSHVYLGSKAVQDAVEAQRAALENGSTTCAKAYATLHAADFPLPRLN